MVWQDAICKLRIAFYTSSSYYGIFRKRIKVIKQHLEENNFLLPLFFKSLSVKLLTVSQQQLSKIVYKVDCIIDSRCIHLYSFHYFYFGIVLHKIVNAYFPSTTGTMFFVLVLFSLICSGNRTIFPYSYLKFLILHQRSSRLSQLQREGEHINLLLAKRSESDCAPKM